MYSICVGEIGISPNEFWLMSYKEVILTIRGYNERELKGWQKARLIAYQVYASVPKKEQNMSMQKWFPLASDKKQSEKISREEMIEARRFFANKIKVNNN